MALKIIGPSGTDYNSSWRAPTLGHVDQTSCEQSHAVCGLMVVQVLEPPATDVGLLIHQAGLVADHLQEMLLLAFVQVLVQEVVGSGKSNQ